MYDYITKELPDTLRSFSQLDVDRVCIAVRCKTAPVYVAVCKHSIACLCIQASITGHSMGGHGALVLGLRNPRLYRSISAFAPICSPSQVPWGEKGANSCRVHAQ